MTDPDELRAALIALRGRLDAWLDGVPPRLARDLQAQGLAARLRDIRDELDVLARVPDAAEVQCLAIYETLEGMLLLGETPSDFMASFPAVRALADLLARVPEVCSPETAERLAAMFAVEFLTGHYRELHDDEQPKFEQLKVIMLTFAAQLRQSARVPEGETVLPQFWCADCDCVVRDVAHSQAHTRLGHGVIALPERLFKRLGRDVGRRASAPEPEP